MIKENNVVIAADLARVMVLIHWTLTQFWETPLRLQETRVTQTLPVLNLPPLKLSTGLIHTYNSEKSYKIINF